MCLVKINCQEETGLVPQHRVNTHNEIAASLIPAREMPTNDFLGHRKETTLGAIDTLNSGLLAYPRNPFIGAGWLIP